VSFYPEILKPRQREVLYSLGPVATRHGFYLGGGTAIALHLGHRRSVDFDWFLQPLFEDPLELAREFQEEGIPFVTGWTRQTTLYGTVRGVRVSFFQFRYQLLGALVPWPEPGCELAALEDLACMKLSATSQGELLHPWAGTAPPGAVGNGHRPVRAGGRAVVFPARLGGPSLVRD
jgi:hypothetical protein